jgi:D-amino peptidase
LATEVEKEEGMRVLISVDMEGLAGVVTGTDVSPGEIDYERNRHLMTNEASAAVRGAHAFSADIETTVADAHGPFTNILPDELDERARLVRGRPRQLGMMSELEGADAAIFVGYHGQSGTATSVLSHTINSGCISDVRCNGRSLGEIGLNASLAAHHGVPVVLVCGDDTVAKEAQGLVEGVATVVVKRALGARAGDSLHPAEACRRIEAAVPGALAHRGAMKSIRFSGPVEVEVDLHYENMAENPLLLPGARRTGAKTIAYSAPDFPSAYRVIRLITVLASAKG